MIETSVIGSYPLEPDPQDIMHQYFTGKMSDYWEKTIHKSISDMINAGITIVTDGQTRDPFIPLFTRHLKGCRIRARTEIIGKIEHEHPITLPDQKTVRTILPEKCQLKGVITGPWTLTCSSNDQFYHNTQDIAFDFATALHKEAVLLQDVVDFISIDEPFFSQEMPSFGKDIIASVTKDIRVPTILHVCGDISKIIEEVIEMPVTILSHEFKASPHLFDVFKEYNFSQNICLGSVRSDNIQIEPIDEIYEHICHGIDIFGSKVIQVAPDCGQRMLTRSIAFKKLKNLVTACEKIKYE